MYKTYKNNINKKCQLFLVSFLNVGNDGLIMQRLKQKNKILKSVKQFRLHPENPENKNCTIIISFKKHLK